MPSKSASRLSFAVRLSVGGVSHAVGEFPGERAPDVSRARHSSAGGRDSSSCVLWCVSQFQFSAVGAEAFSEHHVTPSPGTYIAITAMIVFIYIN